jgi:hypothetical protein
MPMILFMLSLGTLGTYKPWEVASLLVSFVATVYAMIGFWNLKLVADASDNFGWVMAGVAAGTFFGVFLICRRLVFKLGWARPAPRVFPKQWRF